MKGNITRRGVNSWRLKFDRGRDPVTGKRLIEYVTVRGTKKEAQAKLAELLNALNKGTYVERSSVTVAEYMRERLAYWRLSLSPKTIERYAELIENQIVPHLGRIVLQKLRPEDIEAWFATLMTSGRRDRKGGLSARTVGHAKRVLLKALDEAVENGKVARNVAAKKKAPKVESNEVQILNEETIAKLLSDLPGHRLWPQAVTSLFTGMRLGEILALRWNAVTLDGGPATIRVRESLEQTKAGLRFKEPKTKHGQREITLPDIVIEALREHRKQQLELRFKMGLGKLPDDALVFPASPEGEPFPPKRFSRAWEDAAKKIGAPEITFHALRHTHASMLIDQGIDVVMISRRPGHARPEITLRIYAHLFKKDDATAAAAINAALPSLGKK